MTTNLDPSWIDGQVVLEDIECQPDSRCGYNCVKEARAFKKAARSKSPYPWKLWHSVPKRWKPPVIAMGPIHDWRYPGPAYKQSHASDEVHWQVFLDEFAQGTHPWCRKDAA